MDDLENSLAAFAVSTEPNNIAAPHPRFSLHKVKKSSSSQEERRRRYLEAQKTNRFDYISHARGLATEIWEVDNALEENQDQETEDMDCEVVHKKPPRSYRNQLMMSEWLVEVPDDLALNWLLVFCPVGKRSLVIASKNSTKAYSRSGYRLNTFPSDLPGGNKRTDQRSCHTLLDCIYSPIDKTYYVLDVMCWNSHQVYDSDTEFRFYWLQTKIKENPSVSEVSSSNPYKFVPLPHYTCDKNTLRKAINSPLPFSCQLDGLLFFHKQTHYVPGPTPLIGWLKGYMIPEILGIDVPETLQSEKPASYTTMKEFVPQAFQKNEKRKEEEQQSMQCA